jgi:hypothetical protein
MFNTETLNLELELESPEHLELLEQPTLHQNIHPEPEPLKKSGSHNTVPPYNQMLPCKTKALNLNT